MPSNTDRDDRFVDVSTFTADYVQSAGSLDATRATSRHNRRFDQKAKTISHL